MQLTIIRGLPGSGKTTTARKLGIKHHYEADMYFEKDGKYMFNPADIGAAHSWCQQQVRTALKKGEDVVVSNTFCMQWEIQPYIDMAKEFGAEITLIECTGNFTSIHGVPQEVMQRMAEKWEDNIVI